MYFNFFHNFFFIVLHVVRRFDVILSMKQLHVSVIWLSCGIWKHTYGLFFHWICWILSQNVLTSTHLPLSLVWIILVLKIIYQVWGLQIWFWWKMWGQCLKLIKTSVTNKLLYKLYMSVTVYVFLGNFIGKNFRLILGCFLSYFSCIWHLVSCTLSFCSLSSPGQRACMTFAHLPSVIFVCFHYLLFFLSDFDLVLKPQWQINQALIMSIVCKMGPLVFVPIHITMLNIFILRKL